MTFTMSAAQAAILNPEFWKLLLVGASIVMSPDFGEWLLSKYPSTTVYLFAACLPAIPIGTYLAGVGLVHLLFTPLLVLASWTLCVALIALLDLVGRVVTTCVSSVCQGLSSLWTSATVATCRAVDAFADATYRAVDALASLLWEYRKCTAAFVAAASLVSPPFGVVVVSGLAVWAMYQVVLALVYFVQCVDALARAACEAVEKAADQAVRGVDVAVSKVSELMVSAAWSILAFRKCIVAAVVAASLVCPPFGELVVVGLAFWAIYQVVLALVYFVQYVDALARAAFEAAEKVDAALSRAIETMLSAARSILASLFWGAMSLLLSTLTLVLKLLAFTLKTASIADFLVNPCAETFAIALMVKVALALLKYSVECLR